MNLIYKKLFEDLPPKLQKDYGKYLFGDFRKLNEPDTEKEKELFRFVNSWIEGFNGGKPNKKIILALKTLQKLKKYEPEILNSETNVLYRGIKYNLQKLGLKKIKKDDFEFNKSTGFWTSKKTYSYTPHTSIQSWTPVLKGVLKTVQNIMKDRGETIHSNPKSYFIIFKTSFSQQSLLFNHNFMNKLSNKFIGIEEDEVIHIGNSKIKVQILLSEEDHDMAFFDEFDKE